jgi:hypothetical protein
MVQMDLIRFFLQSLQLEAAVEVLRVLGIPVVLEVAVDGNLAQAAPELLAKVQPVDRVGLVRHAAGAAVAAQVQLVVMV